MKEEYQDLESEYDANFKWIVPTCLAQVLQPSTFLQLGLGTAEELFAGNWVSEYHEVFSNPVIRSEEEPETKKGRSPPVLATKGVTAGEGGGKKSKRGFWEEKKACRKLFVPSADALVAPYATSSQNDEEAEMARINHFIQGVIADLNLADASAPAGSIPRSPRKDHLSGAAAMPGGCVPLLSAKRTGGAGSFSMSEGDIDDVLTAKRPLIGPELEVVHGVKTDRRTPIWVHGATHPTEQATAAAVTATAAEGAPSESGMGETLSMTEDSLAAPHEPLDLTIVGRAIPAPLSAGSVGPAVVQPAATATATATTTATATATASTASVSPSIAETETLENEEALLELQQMENVNANANANTQAVGSPQLRDVSQIDDILASAKAAIVADKKPRKSAGKKQSKEDRGKIPRYTGKNYIKQKRDDAKQATLLANRKKRGAPKGSGNLSLLHSRYPHQCEKQIRRWSTEAKDMFDAKKMASERPETPTTLFHFKTGGGMIWR
jgi:hypothetical protein